MTDRPRAADDAEMITARIKEIRAMAVPMCPHNGNMTLHSCLRTTAPCGELCPAKADWTGPEKGTTT